ncbi:MAG: hypothetical protein EZS28_028454 [Streblomastix strix]|uniref:Uncharacterized protein n=1 Tax=Streblomastix strix TaxID=222440 RepID=A0A5J4V0Y2_9EUKA|nr:MAG: hypothetical protein EZS28_028454 [Streblomastix strix]
MAYIIVQMNETGNIRKENQIRYVFENEGLAYLTKIFQNESFEIKKTNNYSAIVISMIHKAVGVPDEIKDSLFTKLKHLALSEDNEMIYLSSYTLSQLAECPDNHPFIISSELPAILRKNISSNSIHLIGNGIKLALNLLYCGSDGANGIVKEGVPLDEIRELSQEHENEDEYEEIFLLSKLLSEWLQFIS